MILFPVSVLGTNSFLSGHPIWPPAFKSSGAAPMVAWVSMLLPGCQIQPTLLLTPPNPALVLGLYSKGMLSTAIGGSLLITGEDILFDTFRPNSKQERKVSL